MPQFTVLAGDLVGSTALGADRLEVAFAALLRTTRTFEEWLRHPVCFTRNRGDGWQIVLPPERPGLREALALRAGLRAEGKAFQTRIAIATGPGAVPDSRDLNEASGDGFAAAGRLLDGMEGALMAHAGGGALAATVILADTISQGWTPAQARAVLPMLAPDPPTHAEVADSLGITRQAVQQALAAAQLAPLTEALHLIETT